MKNVIANLYCAALLTTIVGLASFTNAQAANEKTPPVTYYEKSKVDASFAKAAMLFDASNGRNYTVITGHRDKPGQAELHTKDDDVIYVLQGTATFITGGKVVDAKTTAADEVRGAGIKGGESRKLSQGDVIIIPHN